MCLTCELYKKHLHFGKNRYRMSKVEQFESEQFDFGHFIFYRQEVAAC